MKIGIVYDTLQKSKGHHGTHFAFTGLPNTEIILADPNPNPVEAGRLGAARHYADWREMLDCEHPAITVVCSRLPDDHEPVVTAALEHGSHVFCEKPLCSMLTVADRMAELAEKRNLLIGVAHLARYSPVFTTVKRLIESGAIGRPLTFYGRGKEDERGGGEDLVVLGTHILDIGNFLFGKPESVTANVLRDNRPAVKEDAVEATEPVGPVAGDSICAVFQYANGVNGFFESRKGLFRGAVRMGITVAGTEGCLSVRYDNERKIRLTRSPYPPEDEAAYEIVPVDAPPEIPGAEPLRSCFDGNPDFWRYFTTANRYAARDMMEAIREGRRPRSGIDDATIVLEMIYGIYSSHFAGARIAFPLTDRKHPLL